jgi:hypothetical protein
MAFLVDRGKSSGRLNACPVGIYKLLILNVSAGGFACLVGFGTLFSKRGERPLVQRSLLS